MAQNHQTSMVQEVGSLMSQVGEEGWKLYRRVPRRALPIHVFRHLCCRMYRLAQRHRRKDGRWKTYMHACTAVYDRIKTYSLIWKQIRFFLYQI